jgi:hypothetical protein
MQVQMEKMKRRNKSTLNELLIYFYRKEMMYYQAVSK